MDGLVTTDEELAVLAARQHGVVASRQLALTQDAVDGRCHSGRLHRMHQGVYAVGHVPATREARWMAAVLACGEGAVLSHRSAATLWRIRDGEGRRPDVTSRARRRHAGITAHRAELTPADVTVHRGIPVTTVARTLADLAHELSLDDLARALREAQYLKLYDMKELREVLQRRPSRALRELLPHVVTQSAMEDRFLKLCRRHGLPEPVRQHRIAGHPFDFAWPGQRVVVETDGWQAHSGPHAFQADRTLTNTLQLHGWTVLRFTWRDLTTRSHQVAAAVRSALYRSATSATGSSATGSGAGSP
jgi:very-short-patch-repair endonuclease